MVVEEQELGVMSGDQLAAAIVDNHAELLAPGVPGPGARVRLGGSA